jgi:hypothetical protein
MTAPIQIEEKYERNGWPAVKRPDLKPPDGRFPPTEDAKQGSFKLTSVT